MSMIMHGEQKRIWEDMAMSCFKVLFWHSPGVSDRNNQKPQSG